MVQPADHAQPDERFQGTGADAIVTIVSLARSVNPRRGEGTICREEATRPPGLNASPDWLAAKPPSLSAKIEASPEGCQIVPRKRLL